MLVAGKNTVKLWKRIGFVQGVEFPFDPYGFWEGFAEACGPGLIISHLRHDLKPILVEMMPYLAKLPDEYHRGWIFNPDGTFKFRPLIKK